MAGYVDCIVVPVPKAQVEAYRRLARKCAKVWREHGALSYAECMADNVKPGKHTSFPQAVKLKADEVVWVAWITYKSRRQRDQVFDKVMSDPRLAKMAAGGMPFDGKRMFWGGFQVKVQA